MGNSLDVGSLEGRARGDAFVDLLVTVHLFTMNGGVLHGIENLTAANAHLVAGAYELIGLTASARAIRLAWRIVETDYADTEDNDCAESESNRLYYDEVGSGDVFFVRLGAACGTAIAP